MSKSLVRQQLLDQRRSLQPDTVARMSRAVQDVVLGSSLFARAETVALYAAIDNEVRTERLQAAALAAGKRLCYPRLEQGRIVFVGIDGHGDLRPGSFDVPEPVGGDLVAPEEFDLLLVPGVGFDRHGHRIGYGLGYYDRVLAECHNAEFIGLAYSFQVVERLPEEEHDIRLDYLATESGLIGFQHTP